MASMAAPLELPDGLHPAPLVASDAAAVTAVIAAQELADVGEVVIEEADIVADWQRPGYDVAAGTLGVFDGDRLVAYADVGYRTAATPPSTPTTAGRGIGTELARWMQERAREQGWDLVGMPVPQGSPGDGSWSRSATTSAGTAGCSELPEGATIPERPLPEGYAVRAATEAEYDRRPPSRRTRSSSGRCASARRFEDWQSQTIRRPGFEPWHLRVVTDPSGEVVATALVQMNADCAYIARLATRKDQRGRASPRRSSSTRSPRPPSTAR